MQELNIRTIPAPLVDLCRSFGERSGVVDEIHPKDYIFWFSFDMPTNSDKSVVVKEYFEGGEATAAHLRKIIGDYRPIDQPFSLLEFAAGYGRITRHLKKVLPAAHVVACDIHDEAVEFLRHIGTEAITSSTIPEELKIGVKFDVIYALSFFTHMPKRTWGRWLAELGGRLAPNGILIFTTHGESALKILGAEGFSPEGFWFTDFSEQKDLSTVDYGAAATSFDFGVFRRSCG